MASGFCLDGTQLVSTFPIMPAVLASDMVEWVMIMLFQPIRPMLMHKSDDLVPGSGYIHQPKYDGHRALLHINQGMMRIFTRHQNDCTDQYPELLGVNVKADNCILDGEIITLDEEGKPCFEYVMERFQAKRHQTITRLSQIKPVHFVAFDVLFYNGKSVIHLPLVERLQLLPKIVVSGNAISVCPTYDDGSTLFNNVVQASLEGIVSKRKSSRYQLDVRTEDWLKIKNYQFDQVQISAIAKNKFAWLLVKDGNHVGVAEFAPSAEKRAFREISNKLVVGEDKNWVYVEPLVTCKVKFQCYTKKGLMRSPAVMGFVL